MNAGDVFRFVNIADIHVWMIISEPARDRTKVLMVSFTTWQPHLDQACILEAGEHPFVVHRTVVDYSRAKIVTDVQLESLRRAGRLQFLDSLSPAAEKDPPVRDAVTHDRYRTRRHSRRPGAGRLTGVRGSDKLGTSAPFLVGPLSIADTLVTDAAVPDETVQTYTAAGLRVTRAAK